MGTANFSLENKVALVTGGSRGIGRAIALTFAENGADVAISSRKLPDLEQVAEEIRATGRKGIAISSHIAKAEESRNLVDRVKKEFGRIDILVNNAGTNPYMGPLVDAEEWAWDVVMNVNLKGPFLLSQMVARVMQEQGSGNIINIASTAGINPSALHMYSVSKAAMIMLTRVMAMEWGKDNIRVNAIAPGLIKTRFSEALWKGTPAEDRAAIPEDVAGAALYLASDASRFVNGQTIVVSDASGR
jgi:NAD(P)-dependent dehydrogenase (short-subunit alcohol dehydrogenase family)